MFGLWLFGRFSPPLRRELTEPAGRPTGRRTKNEIGRASWEHRAVGRFSHFGTHRTGRPAARFPPDATIFRTHTAGRFHNLSAINLNSN